MIHRHTRFTELKQSQDALGRRIESLTHKVERLDASYRDLLKKVSKLEAYQEEETKRLVQDADHLRIFANELLANLADLIELTKQNAKAQAQTHIQTLPQLPAPSAPAALPISHQQPAPGSSRLLNMLIGAARMASTSKLDEESIREIAKLTEEEKRVLLSQFEILGEEVEQAAATTDEEEEEKPPTFG